MSDTSWELARDAARDAAVTAWGAIGGLYETGSHVEFKSAGPTTEADKLADHIIQAELMKKYPSEHFGYLTEETEDGRRRLDCRHVWIVDPIDGTKDFIKKNGNFAIHIGLVERDDEGIWQPVVAAVYRPIPGEMYTAIRGQGSFLEVYKDNQRTNVTRPLRVSERAPITEMKVVISSSHRTDMLSQLVAEMRFKDVLSIGSIGIKMSLIARGDYDVYINLARGKCREWDICAPSLILSEAGGTFTGLDGSGFQYNKEDTCDRSGLVASNGKAHQEVVDAIAAFESAND